MDVASLDIIFFSFLFVGFFLGGFLACISAFAMGVFWAF